MPEAVRTQRVKRPMPVAQVTGKRKEAVARVRFRPGAGSVVVNGRPVEVYFPALSHRNHALEPLRVAGMEEEMKYDIDATIDGGGISGQAGALRLGISRALVQLEPELKSALKQAGLLTRDSRVKESKKYGFKKARKAPQYSKR